MKCSLEAGVGGHPLGQVVEGARRRAGTELRLDRAQDGRRAVVRVVQVGVEPADSERAGLVGEPAVVAAYEVGDHRVALRQDVAVRALPQDRVRPGAAERRVAVAGHGSARARQHLAVVHLLVEAAEAQLALVTGLAQHSLNL